MRIPQTLAIMLTGALLVTACSSPVKLDDKASVEDRSGSTTGQTADPRSVGTVNATRSGMDPLNDPQGVLAKRSIYFDLDSYTVKDEFKPVLEAHARYLNANKARQIVIQGNTDERGSREYNLALGQKRADAVRSRLQILGATAAQIETISYGEERPRCKDGNESCWSQNRRADIVYK